VIVVNLSGRGKILVCSFDPPDPDVHRDRDT
jgi:hypothetical protein